MDLKWNKIHIIESGAWNGLVSLEKLDLDHNEIKALTPDSFIHLSKCKELDLKWNKIDRIERGAWNGLISLKELDLDHNEIQVLQSW